MIEIIPEVLEDSQALKDLFDLLIPSGYTGTLDYSATSATAGAPLEWRMTVRVVDELEPTGVKTLTATVGDVKVTIGSNVTVMTVAAYEATYGPLTA